MGIKLASSILSADFSRLGEEIRAVEKAGVDFIHVDIMDGHFVPNLTIGPAVVKSIRKITSLPFNVHLMINNPDEFIKPFADAGGDYITVHVEACKDLSKTIKDIKALGKKAGVAINPGTDISKLKQAYPNVDLILVMSVNPGFGGQEYIPHTLDKIKNIKKARDTLGLKFAIEVDGGIKVENIDKFSSAGADIIVSGSGIFHQKDYAAIIKKMKSIIG
ncbi:MAG: ribulose-phosphate 3-epimerase [Deltaproteobacteria bacterium RIFCSPHIGHO2_12_FULL_43_9]|nr:MAG: ribulose-phosphate 3-epimerase [Deltaproteobacteria bacterium RIFCSPHIGHO2_12_FULL_43_9]